MPCVSVQLRIDALCCLTNSLSCPSLALNQVKSRLAILRNLIFIPGKGKISAQEAGCLTQRFRRRHLPCLMPGSLVCWDCRR